MRSDPKLLSLRPWLADDAQYLVSAWNDPSIAAGAVVPDNRTLADAQRWIAGCGQRERHLLAIDRVIDVGGEPVGEVGVSSIDQRRGAALMGWWVHRVHRGQGYATRAVTTMLSELFASKHPAGVSTVLAEIGPDNRVSRQVAKRCGFVVLRETAGDRNSVFVAQADKSTTDPVARGEQPR